MMFVQQIFVIMFYPYVSLVVVPLIDNYKNHLLEYLWVLQCSNNQKSISINVEVFSEMFVNNLHSFSRSDMKAGKLGTGQR